MTSTPQKQLERYLRQFAKKQIPKEYLELYNDQPKYQYAFAWLHEQYNNAFDFMNYKAPQGLGGHYNAEESRGLIAVNDELSALMKIASKAGIKIIVMPEYTKIIDSSREWLTPSGGSPIPENLTPISVEKYDSVFEIKDSEVLLNSVYKAPLQFIGEGSYAVVHKFIDPNYGIFFARKKLKKNAGEKEIQRFHREYNLMKRFDFPYILQVYQYNNSNNSYTMEYCEYSLKDYIAYNNSTLSFGFRHKIAIQFLYAMNFLHNNGICHRDLSYKNILIHTYKDGSAFTVKLSDFGLAKELNSELTSTGSVMKGSIKDPTLISFKEFNEINDIYAIGFILSYIFTGKEGLLVNGSQLSSIIQRCSNNDTTLRYHNVREIIEAIKSLLGSREESQPQ